MKAYVLERRLGEAKRQLPDFPSIERPLKRVATMIIASLVVAIAASGCGRMHAPPPLNVSEAQQRRPCPPAARAKSLGHVFGRLPTAQIKRRLQIGELMAGSSDVTKWVQIAYQGDPFAQYRIGAACAAGTAFEKNESEAVKWYEKSATQEQHRYGMTFAEHALGIAYFTGRGVTSNERLGLYWLKRAAKRSEDARDTLADMERRKALGLPLMRQ